METQQGAMAGTRTVLSPVLALSLGSLSRCPPQPRARQHGGRSSSSSDGHQRGPAVIPGKPSSPGDGDLQPSHSQCWGKVWQPGELLCVPSIAGLLHWLPWNVGGWFHTQRHPHPLMHP